MATATDSEILTLPELREIISSVDPAAILVEPRILRRVIKQDRKLAGLALFVPHRKAYVIQRERLLVIASRSELNVSTETELPASGDLPGSVPDACKYSRIFSSAAETEMPDGI